MFDLVRWYASLEKYGHACIWHQLSLLSPGAIKQYKPNQVHASCLLHRKDSLTREDMGVKYCRFLLLLMTIPPDVLAFWLLLENLCQYCIRARHYCAVVWTRNERWYSHPSCVVVQKWHATPIYHPLCHPEMPGIWIECSSATVGGVGWKQYGTRKPWAETE